MKRSHTVKIIPLLLISLGLVGSFVSPVLVTAHPQAVGVISSTTQDQDMNAGIIALSSGLAMGLSAIGAGFGLAAAASAAIGAITERPEVFGRTIIFAALIEGIAIFGFVIGLLLWLKIP